MSKALTNKIKLNDLVSVKDFGAVGAGMGYFLPADFQGIVVLAAIGPVPYGTHNCFITVHDAPQ